jgi:hypothetical protein
MTAETVIDTSKKVWGTIIGWTATGLGIVGGIIAIITFMQSYSRYDLSGQWNLANTIESTSYNEYKNLKLGYRLFLTQQGTALTGTGEKWTENGKSIPPSAHTHIKLTGSVSGNKVIATFQEDGTDRKTEGTLSWTYDPKTNSLVGTFTSTAANASGRSAAQVYTE